MDDSQSLEEAARWASDRLAGCMLENLRAQLDELEAMESILSEPGELCVLTPERLGRIRSLCDVRDHRASSSNIDATEDEGKRAAFSTELSEMSNGMLEVQVSLRLELSGRIHSVQLALSFPVAYPSHRAPKISVSSASLSRETSRSVACALAERCSELIGQCMLLEAVQFVREAAMSSLSAPKDGAPAASLHKAAMADPGSEPLCYSVTHIDHMHARTHYCRTLRAWARELGVGGRVVFVGRLILLVLESRDVGDLGTFLRYHRTRPVDVDTSGRTCKEHCMALLMPPAQLVAAEDDGGRRGEVENSAAPGNGRSSARFTDFSVLQLDSWQQLEDQFTSWRLSRVFRDCVRPLRPS